MNTQPALPRSRALREGLPSARGYGIALLAVVGALLICLGLGRRLDEQSFYLLFALAVIISAGSGGWGPGLFATALGALAVVSVSAAIHHTGFPGTHDSIPALLFYLVVGAGGSGLCESLHRARRESEQARQASEERLRHVSAQVPCLWWRADVEDRGGELLHWTMKLADPEAAQRFFPLNIRSVDEYQQAWYFSRLAEDRLRTDAFGAAEIRAGRSYHQEFRCRRADGEIRWLAEDIRVETVAPGRWRTAGVCTDITDRKRLEEQLRDRADEFARADRSKDQFLAVLAHELRNPIGVISNALQLLKLRVDADPGFLRTLQVIERQVDLQAHLLDDLLDVSRLVRGNMALKTLRVDLRQLVRDVAEDQRVALERAGLALEVHLPDEPVWLIADPPRLAQVLSNLLHNAGKFTDPGGRISLRVDADLNARQARISVRDTGIGIEPEFIPHLFESFMQAERTLERSRAGLGLGLALVKGLVELHGGTVSGHSDGPGTGAEFTIALPLADAVSTSPAPSPAALLPTGAWRILIIEDNVDAASTLAELLEALGCQVAVAGSGVGGIEVAQQFQPEIVFCDLGLPDLDGYQVARALRRLPVTAAASLIAVSGYGQEEDRRRSQQAGFDRHLTKPLHFDELRHLLELAPRGPSESANHRGDKPL